MDDKQVKPEHDMDERVSIPLEPEEALRALLKVDPAEPPAQEPRAALQRSAEPTP